MLILHVQRQENILLPWTISLIDARSSYDVQFTTLAVQV